MPNMKNAKKAVKTIERQRVENNEYEASLKKAMKNVEKAVESKDKDKAQKEYRAYYEKYGDGFKVGMGAEAVKELLKQVDLGKEIEEIRKKLETAQGQKRTSLLKRLDILDAVHKSGNEPEWMILDAIPVIPPELRPMIQLD